MNGLEGVMVAEGTGLKDNLLRFKLLFIFYNVPRRIRHFE